MQFKGKTFIVTGGASGLGGATTKALVECGAHVVVADIKGEAPEGAEFVQTDVTNEDSVAAMVEKANADGTLSGVVNCAGIGIAEKTVGKKGPHDLGNFTKVVTVNLISSTNPGAIAPNIALQFPESTGIEVNTLIATGLALFVITFAVNFASRAIVNRRAVFSGAN